MKELETPNLVMRKFREDDVDDLFEVTSNKKVAEASDFNVHETKEDTLMEIETAIQDYDTYDACWAIEEKTAHKVIGYINMINVSLKNKQCTLF